MGFINDYFLLKNETAKNLYDEYAKDLPIIDYHCHVSPKEIAENKSYENLTQVWLSADHYKWRIIRANGVKEDEITGNSSDWIKFLRYAEALPRAIGNPLYHWTHLELKRYFDCDLILNPKNAEEIWNECNNKLQNGLTVRKMITDSKVEVICTTDDPIDDLTWHKEIKDDKSFNVKVLPAFRPDKALNIESNEFKKYILKLSDVSDMRIKSLNDLFSALESRIEYFASFGCKLSDHALDYCFYNRNKSIANRAFTKKMTGKSLTFEEVECYKTELLLFFAESFKERDWTMQIHYGSLRSVNTKMKALLGPDTGFDCISSKDSSNALVKLLDGITMNSGIPKLIIYSVNPNDNAMIDSVIGCFQTPEVKSKIQHGSAWWFNDTKHGIEDHLLNLSSIGVLGNFIGMLTDSRSFLSYTRHEYFRRILCNFLGSLIENGEYPNDTEYIKKIVQGVSYNNALSYFKF